MAASSELQQLRDLLLAPEVITLQTLKRELAAVQQLVQDPEQFAKLIDPILAELIRREDPAVSLAILKAVTPLLDRAVRDKTDQDRSAMTHALAPVSTGAIAVHYAETPESAAQDMAPLVSAAIKEQIRRERDAFIDALYPVIGSTISKYLSETMNMLVQRMNERIESHLSLGSIVRKLRSRITGVSEAELLMRDSLWCRVDAAFLIHKSSGLVIAQSQNPGVPPLDPDLLSGMLTAIRSLFNESMTEGDRPRELDQIAYGESKIVLEVAGFFYLAAVVRGVPTDSFRSKLRETVSEIVQLPGETIAHFEGDQARIPDRVPRLLQELVQGTYGSADRTKRRTPYGVLWAGAILLLAIAIPLGIYLYRNAADRELETRTRDAILAADSLSFKQVVVRVDRDRMQLYGTVSNDHQWTVAARLAGLHSPAAEIENRLTTLNAPLLPVLLKGQAEAIGATLNTIEGVYLDVRLHNGDLVVSGLAPDAVTLHRIEQTFANLPGVRSFRSGITHGEFEIADRLLFAHNSTMLRPGTRAGLEQVKTIAQRTPWSALRIIGHSDLTGEDLVNQRLALGRATGVRAALIRAGIAPDRIIVEGSPGPPPDASMPRIDSLSRCVRFMLIFPRPTDQP